MKTNLAKIALILLIVLITASCSKLDVVAAGAVKSFEAIQKSADIVEQSSGAVLNAPDGSAKFVWSTDYSQNTLFDVYIETDAAPFIEAGLDSTKLPAGVFKENRIIFGQKIFSADENSGKDFSAGAFKTIVSKRPDLIGYHQSLDHYGIDLNGAMFEWAKDIKTNDKDIVFVIDPKIFVQAGVDPEKVQGWLYAEIEVMDKGGNKSKVKKFLKPFNL